MKWGLDGQEILIGGNDVGMERLPWGRGPGGVLCECVWRGGLLFFGGEA